MDTNEQNQKSSKAKAYLVFGGLILGAVASVMLMKYSAAHSVDEKKLGAELVRMQEHNHKIFKPNDENITKALFDKFPEAQSVLIGNVYITDNTFKLLVRPTIFTFDENKSIDTFGMDNDGLSIYEVRGDLKSGIASNYTIRPWHPELEKKDESWSWTIESLTHKALSAFVYVLPGMDTFVSTIEDTANRYAAFSTENLPFAIHSRPKEDTSSSGIFSVVVVNSSRLNKSSQPGSPIALRSDELGCVFTAWPEYIKDDRFRLEVKDIACKNPGTDLKGVSIIGEDGKYGVGVFEENGTFLIGQGRSFSAVAKAITTH